MDLLPNGHRPGYGKARAGNSSTADAGNGPPGGSRSRTLRGRLWRGTKLVVGAPVAAFPLGQIMRNGRLIGGLVSDLRRGPPPPRMVPQQRDGKLDRSATAIVYGLSERELDERLALRRRQTARMAWLAFTLGWMCVIAWLLRLLGLEGMGPKLLAVVQFAPFCLMFFLTAFQQAHVNWQLRTGLLGSAGDYLRSPEPFWPRP